MPDDVTPQPAPPVPQEAQDWSPLASAKKVGWAMVAWKSAVAAGVTMAPVLSGAIDKISDFTEPYGITISVDSTIFDKFVPVVIFAAMIVAHDMAKFKTGSKFL